MRIGTHPSCSELSSVKRLLRPLPARLSEESDRLVGRTNVGWAGPAPESVLPLRSKSLGFSFSGLLLLRPGMIAESRLPESSLRRLSSTDLRRMRSLSFPSPPDVDDLREVSAFGSSSFELSASEFEESLFFPSLRLSFDTLRGAGSGRSVVDMVPS